MNSHLTENILTANPRFHMQCMGGLYEPIAFAFVAEQMCQDILDERRSILAAIPADCLERQQKLLEHYDPEVSRRTYMEILAMFGCAPGE